ncbi:helicase C-terminal domain-containing protein [Tepidiforma sp.]|uniref:helicase C-terminal domain-containing protein n=1 Tax=Tepidiforma sp. TaxID=2682230 RepID=UPI00262A831D|nr:helicase C-terminal domain-containing protein [Tepidiforma sp.]MCX7616798.1 exonuclease domain-containing protein [Tepidiforma sp.]
MTAYIALDLETTGLDPARDRIIEVGAIRFTEAGEEAEFSSLVNPGRRLSPFIERLTGITNRDVAAAPPLERIAEELRRFVRGHTIVGHNIEFDLEFLRAAGVAEAGDAVDTAALARLLLPDLKNHGLADVAGALGLEPDSRHRALSDARLAARVFTRLLRLARELEPDRRATLAALVAGDAPALARVLAEDGRPPEPRPAVLPVPLPFEAPPPLTPRNPPVRVARGDVEAVFRALAAGLPGFEQRDEQMAMAEAVRRAFDHGGHLMVEAGTGVGKSLAYLVPAALDAVRNGRRAVVSTNTIALQEQLLQKDIPVLREALVRAGVIRREEDLRVSLLKGRGNYLCYARWLASYVSGARDPDVARLSANILLWIEQTRTGDRAELRLGPEDWMTWARLSAADADCLSRQHRHVREGNCFLWRARKTAESAHLLIVNHALLLADIASGGSAIPSFDHLIVDEAHNLEDVATQQFGGALTARALGEALDGIHRPGTRDHREGGAVLLLRSFEGEPYAGAARALLGLAGAAREAARPFFEAVGSLPGRDGEGERLLLSSVARREPAWERVEALWEALAAQLERVERAGEEAGRLLGNAPVEAASELAGEFLAPFRRLADLRRLGGQIVNPAGAEMITWAERTREGVGSLHMAPIDVGPILWEQVFEPRRAVVATSATLSANHDMSFAAQRLGLQDPETLELGSPFDYERAALLAAVDDLPEPNHPDFPARLAAAIGQLARASRGRAMALFTSNALLRQVSELVRPVVEPAGIVVLAQGIDGTPRWITEQLRENHETLVLGSASFWEGVDIRGEALSLVMITRLPFDVPTDPVARARAEQYDDPFNQYQVPAAILRFRQGFGRLIRDRRDRGVVAVFDRRLWEKRYGRQFIDSLPPCTRFKGSTREVAAAIEAWLDR